MVFTRVRFIGFLINGLLQVMGAGGVYTGVGMEKGWANIAE